ncbi:MAG: hypothetical protein AAF567_16780 [Actinomycetota bacterium]
MEISEIPPDDFLASFDDLDDGGEIAATMTALDALIVASLPERRRVLWTGRFWGGTDQTIIGYGDIRQPRPRGDDVEWFLVGLARQSKNYSIYLNAAKDGTYLAHAYVERLGKVKLGAASIGFRRLDEIDLEVLGELLSEAHELTPADPS